ncbi:MAG TPA: glycolate oxidase subunit GlcF [Burkholderiales bacterium]|jgi:glycolate oxidase iron-sulfur subunit|nr:glycolate oxidase subunit GlcF [Burkholderiales bacterium]
MKTNLAEPIRGTPEGREADRILRTCVHCGFCTATCPTYQLLGDELDGPRGRIYLIKELLEGKQFTRKTQLHLDRCLTCRACETTCPSGVEYGHLVDIGRNIVEQQLGRPLVESVKRAALRAIVPNPALFTPLLRLGQLVRPLLPGGLRRKVPAPQARAAWPAPRHARRMLVLDGCVQPAIAPNINAATARVLDAIGISLLKAENAGCCGAVTFHLDRQREAAAYMRRNIDAWWPYVEAGVETIVTTASGCAVMVKDYGHALAHDPAYADKGRRIAELTRDIGEVLFDEREKVKDRLTLHPSRLTRQRVAFHSPCTLQHGLKIREKVEVLLREAAFELTFVPDSHLCCGSAGTYSILQPQLSRQLLKNKIEALQSGDPALIATANIGCLTHIQSGAAVPVRHWVELLAERLVES